MSRAGYSYRRFHIWTMDTFESDGLLPFIRLPGKDADPTGFDTN